MKRSFCPRVELLEDRTVPAVDVTTVAVPYSPVIDPSIPVFGPNS